MKNPYNWIIAVLVLIIIILSIAVASLWTAASNIPIENNTNSTIENQFTSQQILQIIKPDIVTFCGGLDYNLENRPENVSVFACPICKNLYLYDNGYSYADVLPNTSSLNTNTYSFKQNVCDPQS